MTTDKASTTKIVATSHITGLWFAGWLFTIGFVHLGFWKAVLAVVAWPYFLGTILRAA